MAISNQGIVGTGPGYGSEQFREFHLEYPFGGMSVNSGAVPLPKGPLTVSLWCSLVRPTNGESAAIAVCTRGGPESCYLGMDESGQNYELFVGDRTATTGNPIPGYTWHHYGFRSDGFNHALYIDGARVLQLNEKPSKKPFDRICLLSSTAPAQLCGSIAGVKMWSALLDEPTLFAEGRALHSIAFSNPALYAFWPLASAADLTDHSGNSRTLVPSSNFFVTTTDPVTKFLSPKPPRFPQENPSGSAYPPLTPRQVPPNSFPQPFP